MMMMMIKRPCFFFNVFFCCWKLSLKSNNNKNDCLLFMDGFLSSVFLFCFGIQLLLLLFVVCKCNFKTGKHQCFDPVWIKKNLENDYRLLIFLDFSVKFFRKHDVMKMKISKAMLLLLKKVDK